MRPILATATSYQGHEPLTNEVMRRYAPSIFAESAHTSRSNKYAYIPTVEIVEGLRKEGFHRYRWDDHWRCPPGEAYATALGLTYLVQSSAEINWTFQTNIQ